MTTPTADRPADGPGRDDAAVGTGPAYVTSRRERLRESTLREIREEARRLLVQEGPAAISLRAIAREMGMTAPALYRYYPSQTDVVQALAAQLYDELTAELEKARDRAPGSGPGSRLQAVCRRLRTWSLEHPAEFELTFASPPRLTGGQPCSPAEEAGMRFGLVFYTLIEEVWRTRPFPTPDPAELDPRLLSQLTEASLKFGGQMPPEAMHVFVACWVRIYGLVTMELFGQLEFALTDVAPMYEELLRELAARLDFEYEPPPEVPRAS